MRFISTGYNGSALQTNSLAFLGARVDSSYTANGANIPLGWLITVNDTNGGTNNQAKTHNFYSNGNVVFSTSSTVTANGGFSTTGNVNANYVVATQSVYANDAIVANSYLGTLGNVSIWDNLGNNGAFARFYGNMTIGNSVTSSKLELYGDKTTLSGITIRDGQYRVISDAVNPTTGFSPLNISSYNNANATIPSNRFFRGRGTEANTQPVVTNDQIMTTSYAVYADSGNTYLDTFNDYVFVNSNDGAGNVTATYQIRAFNTGSIIELKASNVSSNGNITTSGFVSAANVVVQTSGFMKLASYTAAALTAITGQIGWMAAVSNSGGGGNPNGMVAFWDTTNSRWSYIHDNSAV
jgi:hypothetical protein